MPRWRVRNLIVISAVILLILIAGIMLLRETGSKDPGQLDAPGPGNVAFDYQMALIRKDFAKAYEYLSPALNHYPEDVNEFVALLEQRELLPMWSLSPCIYLEDVVFVGEEAIVSMREQLYDPCVGGVETTNLTYEFLTMRLRREAGAWKIVDGSDHFDACWSDPSRCE